MHILQLMLYKDGRLICEYKLQQIPQKLIISLIAILVRIPHPLILRHIKVHQSHLITHTLLCLKLERLRLPSQVRF